MGGTLRVVTDPQDPAVEAFADLVARTFPDPDLVVTAEGVRRRVAGRVTPERIDFLLVAEEDGRLTGAAAFCYLPGPDAAFSGYLVVDRTQRGRGWGRRLFNERARLLREAAAGLGRPGPRALFIEVANPLRLPPDRLAAERAAGMDPVHRRRIFRHFGFQQVAVRYVEPPARPGGQPVTYMDLLCLVTDPELQRAGWLPAGMVLETLRHAWPGYIDAEAYLADLRAQVQGDRIPLVPVEGIENDAPGAGRKVGSP